MTKEYILLIDGYDSFTSTLFEVKHPRHFHSQFNCLEAWHRDYNYLRHVTKIGNDTKQVHFASNSKLHILTTQDYTHA